MTAGHVPAQTQPDGGANDSNMRPIVPAMTLAALEQWLSGRTRGRMVGIAGIPGAGKTSLGAELLARVPGAVVVPMDGYHLPRRLLDEEGIRRRGAPHTFDAAAFRRDIVRLRETGEGTFAGWSHAIQDPTPDAIRVFQDTPLIVVEGLYLLMRAWDMAALFDVRVFIDCDLETAMRRVAARHVACGLCRTADEARLRTDTNDRLNAIDIVSDGCRDRADIVLSGNWYI